MTLTGKANNTWDTKNILDIVAVEDKEDCDYFQFYDYCIDDVEVDFKRKKKKKGKKKGGKKKAKEKIKHIIRFLVWGLCHYTGIVKTHFDEYFRFSLSV